MEEERQKCQHSDFGDGFALLPLGKRARNGGIASWSDALLSVLTILISFENQKTRKSYPSFDTIAALGGISKGAIGDAIHTLEQGEWFTLGREPVGRGRTRYVYNMEYDPYSPSPYSFSPLPSGSGAPGDGEGKYWISVYDDVIKSGVWAIMPPSARKLYIVMKAFTVEGFFANTGWANFYNLGYADSRRRCAEDFDFMPIYVFDGFGKERPTLASLCGIASKTYRDAKNWLTDNELMSFYEGDSYSGLAFPHRPNMFAPKVIEAIENKKRLRDEAARRECTGHVKKSLRAIKARSKQAGQRGGDYRLKKIEHNETPGSVTY